MKVAKDRMMFTRSFALLFCTSAQASGYSRRSVIDDNLKYGGIVVEWNFHVTGSEKISDYAPKGRLIVQSTKTVA